MKRLLSLTLASILALSMFAGCTPAEEETTTPSTEGETETTTEKPSDPEVELTFWAFPTFAQVDGVAGKYEESLAERYMAENPNVNITVEMLDFTNGPDKIVTSIQGGTNPDILFDAPGRIVDYGTSGYLVPLDDMIGELESDISSDAILEACADIDGNYWMYPTSAAPFVMAVNKTFLEAEGLMDMVPTEGDRTWTTAEFEALSKEMQDRGYKGMEVYAGGAGGDQGTRAFISNLTNASIMNDDRSEYTMSNDTGIAAYEYVNNAINEGFMEGNTAGVANDALEHFTTPINAKFWAVNLWSPNLHVGRQGELDASEIEAFPVTLPSEDGTPELEYLVNGYGIFDNGDQAKIDAAKDFVEWLTTDEIGKETVVAANCFPVRESFGNLYGDDADMEYYSSLSKYYGKYYNTVTGFAEMRPFWWGSLQSMLTGERSPSDAAIYFDESANATLS